jgi:hypothetical protein
MKVGQEVNNEGRSILKVMIGRSTMKVGQSSRSWMGGQQ